MRRPTPSAAVFSRVDLRALGWSDSAIVRAVTSGRIVRLRRDQFALTRPDGRLSAIAAARSCAGSVISHRSAALFHGIPLYGIADFRPDLTVQPGQTGDVVGALLHRATLPHDAIVDIDGTAVTSPARTVFDLARHLPIAAGVVALDYALHVELTAWDELDEWLRACRNWPKIRQARRALGLADGRSESVLESVSRLVIMRLGLPKPEPQAQIRDLAGVLCGRVDFYWDEYGVFGEADGRLKYTDGDVLFAEKQRQEAIEDLSLIGVRWGWMDATRQTAALRARLLRGFERGTRLRHAGFPRLWSVQPTPTGRQRGKPGARRG